jgi:hypothetical protein
MHIVLLGPRDTSFNPHRPIQSADMALEDWLRMHFELHGPFQDEEAAKVWVDDCEFGDDRYWAILPIQDEGAIIASIKERL